MKKITWLLVFAILLMSVPAYAADGGSAEERIYKITFEQIEPLMMEKNPTIRTSNNTLETLINSRNSIEDAEEDLDDAIDDLGDAISAMNDAIDKMDDSIGILEGLIGGQIPTSPESELGNGQDSSEGFIGTDGEMPMPPGTDYIPYATLQTLIGVRELYRANVATLRQNRNAMRDQLDQLPNQEWELDKAILQIEMANNSVVWGAQSLYFAYNALERQMDELVQNLELLDDQLRIMEMQQEMGRLTSLAVSAVRNQREQLVLGIETIENQLENLKGEFNLMLGQDFDTDLVIGDIPELAEGIISDMDYDEDVEIALKKNYSYKLQLYDYKIKDNSLEWAEDSGTSDEERAAELEFENAAINYEQARKRIRLNFHKLYQDVKDKFAALEAENKNLEHQQQKYDILNLQYDLGMISRMDWEQGKAEYNNQINKVETARQDLVQAWTQYEWFLRGLELG